MATNHLRTIDGLKKEIEKLKIEKSDLALELGKFQTLYEIERRKKSVSIENKNQCDDYTIKELMRREEEKNN